MELAQERAAVAVCELGMSFAVLEQTTEESESMNVIFLDENTMFDKRTSLRYPRPWTPKGIFHCLTCGDFLWWTRSGRWIMQEFRYDTGRSHYYPIKDREAARFLIEHRIQLPSSLEGFANEFRTI